jgi:nucleoside-triphosphatase
VPINLLKVIKTKKQPMLSAQNRLILWTGPKHCGKTTSASHLTQAALSEGFNVAGVLEPSLYENSKLLGFDILDLQTQKRAPLARCKSNHNKTGPFKFTAEGLKLGDTILSAKATIHADLIIVDEFGPLELKGQGWRKNIDSLLASGNHIILLVVRDELVDAVRQLYTNIPCRELAATNRHSIDEVITILKNRRFEIKK